MSADSSKRTSTEEKVERELAVFFNSRIDNIVQARGMKKREVIRFAQKVINKAFSQASA